MESGLGENNFKSPETGKWDRKQLMERLVDTISRVARPNEHMNKKIDEILNAVDPHKLFADVVIDTHSGRALDYLLKDIAGYKKMGKMNSSRAKLYENYVDGEVKQELVARGMMKTPDYKSTFTGEVLPLEALSIKTNSLLEIIVETTKLQVLYAGDITTIGRLSLYRRGLREIQQNLGLGKAINQSHEWNGIIEDYLKKVEREVRAVGEGTFKELDVNVQEVNIPIMGEMKTWQGEELLSTERVNEILKLVLPKAILSKCKGIVYVENSDTDSDIMGRNDPIWGEDGKMEGYTIKIFTANPLFERNNATGVEMARNELISTLIHEVGHAFHNTWSVEQMRDDDGLLKTETGFPLSKYAADSAEESEITGHIEDVADRVRLFCVDPLVLKLNSPLRFEATKQMILSLMPLGDQQHYLHRLKLKMRERMRAHSINGRGLLGIREQHRKLVQEGWL